MTKGRVWDLVHILRYSRLVQSVEHRNLTPDVGGSNPSTAAKFKLKG